MSKKVIFVIIVLVIIGIVVISRSRKTDGDRAKIETAKAERKNISEQISSSGKSKATQQINLNFQTAGRLAWVGVKEGDSVTQGQAIASLDTQELRRNLEKALRDYSKERNDFEEDKKDTYRNNALNDTIKRVLEKNQWDLEKAVMDVELKDIAYKFATLVSPIPGTVIRVDTPIAGVNVTITATFTIADPASIVFSASVDESDVGKISLGNNAEVELDAYLNKVFTGKVTKIAFAAETSSAGATVFPVEITFSDATFLRTGLNGDVKIIIREIPNVVVIPNEAIKEKDDKKYVIKKINQNYVKNDIKTGTESDNDVEILEGVAEQDEIVVKGFQYLAKELQ